MKCVISGGNAKVFAKAIQQFSKIGSELFLEADNEGLSLRTVNSSRSAFALIKFFPNFFTDFQVEEETSQGDFKNKCKVAMRACLGTFKNMKQVELCKISIDATNSKLIVQLKCKLETIKTFTVSILELETLQAIYRAENCQNKISAPYKIFSEISSNFQMNEEEITLEAAKGNLTIKNYIEGSSVDRRFMRSQLTLKADEFDRYTIGEETFITFCLREFRAFLGLAETINLDFSVNFETAGQPVVFILRNLETFEANLVMSTLSPDQLDESLSTIKKASRNNNTTMESSIQERDSFVRNTTTKPAAVNRKRPIEKTKITTDQSLLDDDDDELFNFNRLDEQVAQLSQSKRLEQPKRTLIKPTERKITLDSTLSVAADETASNILRPTNNISTTVQSIEEFRRKDDTNIISEVNAHVATHLHSENEKTLRFINRETESEGIVVTFKDTDSVPQEAVDEVPNSPEIQRKKRVRQVFKRCFENTYNPRAVPGASQIWAKNSDEEQ